MMRNETFSDGVLIHAEIYDFDTGLVSVEIDGVIVEQHPIPEEVVAAHAREQARQAGLSKLQALGLTEAEALALVGGL